jgi:transposase-like protein
MTEERLPLAELLAKAGDGDFLRSVAEAVVQLLMETDVDGLIGAGRHERSGDRTTYRNGYRDRTLDTRLGSLQLRIPKLRQGSYFPPFLEPRRTSERALVAVIQEAWVGGVSTRRLDDLVQAMGLAGISKSTVSKLCKEIDDRVNAFLDRPLVGEWPYLWLDATYLKQRGPSAGVADRRLPTLGDVMSTIPSNGEGVRCLNARTRVCSPAGVSAGARRVDYSRAAASAALSVALGRITALHFSASAR